MAKKMLIDASHPEETRVVVLDGQRVEEFDFESVNKKQLAGNIYLAKVMRVEPSLQAAFVDYGGNRHGFLSFSEIHPDYYQIPHADREALLAQEAAEEAAAADEDAAPAKGGGDKSDKDAQRGGGRKRGARRSGKGRRSASRPDKRGAGRKALVEREFRISGGVRVRLSRIEPDEAWETEQRFTLEDGVDVTLARSTAEDRADSRGGAAERADLDDRLSETPGDAHDAPETVGGEDAREEIRPRRIRMRDYKIQEVIKKRQILLVQIVKEERGTKGAAVTTYLSLAGRYCVLMPNTARGGGISRKITNAADRKKLKEIAGELEVPTGMGLIVRTAGAQRTRAEIRRDYEYLLRQWESVRELTLRSVAPTLVYEEGNLIKRSIRDLYTKDIEAVLVEGEDGYREAKDFMKMLMPSHAKNVQPYRDDTPLFIRHQVENHLAAMFNPTVQLKSGGYIVIGVTEALVAIDVNSGRSTREHSIEETALKTNLEAAEEVARQLKLRDLAGLIVIDFIDMEDSRNNRAVEKRLKERLASDRARLQLGKISSFGLLEMSRQRLRPGMVEASTRSCPHCHGSGLVRSDDSLALSILRDIEEEGVRGRASMVSVSTPVEIANFLLNHKRERIASIERRYGLQVVIEGDPARISPEYALDWVKDENGAGRPRPDAAVRVDSAFSDDDEDVAEPAAQPAAPDAAEDDDAEGKSRRRGKRGGRRRRKEDEDPLPVIDAGEPSEEGGKPFSYAEESERKSGSDRRGRRGGRGGRGKGKRGDLPRKEHGALAANDLLKRPDALDDAAESLWREERAQDARSGPTPADDAAHEPARESAKPTAEPMAEPESAPKAAEPTREPEPAPAAEPAADDGPPRPKRSGWWSRARS